MSKKYVIKSVSQCFATDSWSELRRVETFCRSMKEDYTITFKSGYRMVAKFEKNHPKNTKK